MLQVSESQIKLNLRGSWLHGQNNLLHSLSIEVKILTSILSKCNRFFSDRGFNMN